MIDFTASLDIDNDKNVNSQTHSCIFSIKSRKKDINKYNQALIEAAANFAPSTLSLMIGAGADINYQDRHGNSALSRALLSFVAMSLSGNASESNTEKCLEIVKLLIVAGATPRTPVNDIYMSKKKFSNCLSFIVESLDFTNIDMDEDFLTRLLTAEVGSQS
ncbi:hypothetical protein [Agarilytica rhodophyticola]|uniref:hypothetical protein n=1 Tax=Agarilytica rhodophyticola TaxID=1737490 RepID=UPI000B344709|nr:hypothetical protein [Agarilytica rhodophyticola]